jgi:hypothetical protein
MLWKNCPTLMRLLKASRLMKQPLPATTVLRARQRTTKALSDESSQSGETNTPAARRTTVKLPDEPYDFTQCVVTITLGLLPCGNDPNDRRIVAMIDSHGEAPTKVLPLNLAQMQPIPLWLQELFDAHIAALPAREAAAKARKDEEARRAAERQARSTRTATATRTNAAGKSAKGKLAKLGDAQDVLFGGGEPMTIAAPASATTPPAPPPVQKPPAQSAPPQPKPEPAPIAPASQPSAPLTIGSAVPAPSKRPSKKQPPLQEADAVQDVLFS